jgi:hypothetical protein
MIRRSLDAADRHQRLSKYVRWRVPIPFSLWATPDCLDGLTAVAAVYGQHTRQRCIPSTAVRREDLERRSRDIDQNFCSVLRSGIKRPFYS